MRMRNTSAMATSSKIFLVPALLVLALLTVFQPCNGRPLAAEREQRLSALLEKTAVVDSSRNGEVICHLCEAAVSLIKEYLEENGSVEDMYPLLESICLVYVNRSLGYYAPYMCPGVVKSYGPVLLYVVAETTLHPLELCQFVRLCNDTDSEPSSPGPLSLSFLRQSWERNKWTGSHQDPHRQTRNPHSNRVNQRFSGGIRGEGSIKKNEDEIVFLHLSDIHLDLQYSEGSPSLCNLYLCCRSWYNGTAPAGHYGNYECDLPLVTLDIIVDAISQLEPQPDFIIYTGDNSPHDLWNETWSSQFQYTDYLVSYLSERLPDTFIYPALGNHESFPESEYIGTLPQYQEMTRKMVQYWKNLVPLPEEALETIADGAYYTVLITENLRLLSFNSDYGYTLNLYSVLNDKNPSYTRQQNWIIDTLEQAEEAGEKVLIIAHIPPGDPGNSLAGYDEFYLNLTRRFRDTIVGHLFGHTHHDEFKLIQDKDGVYGTLLITPSVTPRGRSNPSFRMFSMDSSSYQLLDYQQFHLNLTLANELAGRGIQPKVELAYTTTDLYHLPDLSPSSWATLVERFPMYPDLVSDYLYNMYGQSSSHDRSCDTKCIRDTVCTVSNILNSERKRCING